MDVQEQCVLKVSLTGHALEKDDFLIFLNNVKKVVQEQHILGVSLTGGTLEISVF